MVSPAGPGVAGPSTRSLLIPVHERPRGRVGPPRLPRQVPAWLTLVVPLLLAAPVGLAAGLEPAPTAAVAVGLAVVLGLLLELEWAALLVVGSAPFEDYLVRVDPHVIKGLAVLLVGAWLIRRSGGRLHDRSRSPVLLAALGFVVVLLAATVAHDNGAAGLAVLLRYAGFLAVLLVLADCLRGSLPPRRLARVYVASCAAASVCGVVGYFLGQDRRVGGPIGDPNDFAFFLLPALALALGLRGSGRRAWPYDLAAALCALAIVGTLSRGALVGVAAMTLLALVARMVRLRAALGILVVLGTALAFTAAAFPDLVDVSLHQKEYVAGQNVDERLQLWGAAARMTTEDPVLGLGPGAFALHHRDYMGTLPADVNHPLDVAHDTWLETSSELGLLGLVALVSILVLAYAGAWSRWRRDRDPLAAAVCAALVGTCAAATFVTEQYYLPLWLLAAFGAALAVERTT